MNHPNNVTENVVPVFGCSQAGCENKGYVSMNGSGFNYTEQNQFVCILDTQPEDYVSTLIFQTFVYLVYGIIFLLALVGNGLVCFVVQSSPRMKTVTNFFIMNLAIGDILLTLFCVPFSFVSTLILRYWPFGQLMCKLVNYFQAVSVLVSAYTLLTISVDRYIVITRPLKPRMEKTVAKLVICIVWCGALATAAPLLIVCQLEKPSAWHQVCDLYICSEKWTYPRQSEQYTYALLILQFALPLTALICSYGRIAYLVWGERPPGEAESVRDMRIQHSKRKMVKMMITVVIVFTVCWLPLNIFVLLYMVHENDDDWGRWPGMPYVWFISHCLAMSHSCFNPIIYCYMNAKYRSGFVQVFRKLLCLKNTSAGNRLCHRTGVCERIPLTDFMAINRFPSQRSLSRYKRKINRVGLNSLELNRKCTSCTSLRRTSSPPSAPACAVSVDSHFA